MIISDLNHLEVVEKENQVVGGFEFHLDINAFWANLDVKTNVDDNLAFGKADALAYGPNSYAKANTKTYTDPYTSAAISTSVSATAW